MTASLVLVVLFAALLHASWNAVVRGGDDKLMGTVMVTSAAGGMALLALPWLPAPAAASWGYIAASALVQVVYFRLVAAAYHAGQMSQAYPLIRGTAPLLVALASGPLLGESLSVLRWLALGTLCGGILVLVWQGRGAGRAATGYALINALVIACYTLIDGLGVRLSGAPAAYTLWIFLLTAVPLLLWTLLCRRGAFSSELRSRWHYGLLGGAGTLLSYGLALWAMTLAPVALVAALRETSILFGLLIAWLFLGERIGRVQGLAIALIALGAVLLRLS
ncbi:MAG: EamA family transporter [Pseudomonas sp.]|uniref:EamA family transporter n=1 Tax=Pseudomonas sp. TaxID=306 RepID=UPI00339096E1